MGKYTHTLRLPRTDFPMRGNMAGPFRTPDPPLPEPIPSLWQRLWAWAKSKGWRWWTARAILAPLALALSPILLGFAILAAIAWAWSEVTK